MKGLLIKDIKLLKGQKLFFLVILLMSVGIAIFAEDLSFMIGFLAFAATGAANSTINYDEFDNGNAFLFTLPISRTQYVAEKYCLSALCGIGTLCFTTLLGIVIGTCRGIATASEVAQFALMILPVLLVAQVILIPVDLKFGGQKGRIATVVVLCALVAGTILVTKLLEQMGIDTDNLSASVHGMSMGMMIAAVLAIAVVAELISLRVSIAIMKKKQF